MTFFDKKFKKFFISPPINHENNYWKKIDIRINTIEAKRVNATKSTLGYILIYEQVVCLNWKIEKK